MKTEFHKLLEKAIIEDSALLEVIDKIMPMINKLSKMQNGEIDEDLKSILITYSIEIIRKNKIYKIF